MGNLLDHAERELNLLNNDKDFNNSILAAVKGFSEYGHSGGSASYAIPLLNDLLQFKNVTPITDNPEDWTEVVPELWQCRRNPEVFSDDGGRTYYSNSETLEDGTRLVHQSKSYEPVEDCQEKSDDIYKNIGESQSESCDGDNRSESIARRVEAWTTAEKIVNKIVDTLGLNEYKSPSGFAASITYTEVDQYLDHVGSLADWLLEGR